MPLKPWKVLESSYLVSDRWMRLRADRCETPEGVIVEPYYVQEPMDWVHVVAFDDAGRILINRQYRHGLGTISIELPCGAVEPGEPPMDAMAAGGMTSGGDTEPSGNYDTLVRRGERYAKSGNSSKALQACQKALTLQPNGVEALTGLAYAHLDRGSTGAAIRSFRRALRVSGAYGEALIGLAETYQRVRRYKQALKYYQRYLKHHPSGRQSILAKQNVKLLEDKLKKTEPPMERPMEQPMERPMEQPMERPAAMVREPPPTMARDTRPAPVREPPPTMARPGTGMN